MPQFLAKYPHFESPDIDAEELAKLLEFCNCVRVVQCLIPPNNNKEHILDLVSRLTEGYSVRRVTGTGMTQETRHRYEIIHKEGNLTARTRPEHRQEKHEGDDDGNETDADAQSEGSSTSAEKKRSREAHQSPAKKSRIDSNSSSSSSSSSANINNGLLLLLEAGSIDDKNKAATQDPKINNSEGDDTIANKQHI